MERPEDASVQTSEPPVARDAWEGHAQLPAVDAPAETASQPDVDQPSAAPAPVEPAAREIVADVVSSEPAGAEPSAPEADAPVAIAPESVGVASEAAAPSVAEPVVSEPDASEPIASAPLEPETVATDPVATDPVATESVAPSEPVAEDAPESSGDVPAAPAATPAAPASKPAPSPAVLEERRRRAEIAWQRVVGAHESGETLTGNVFAAVKGGLLVDVGGVRGFLPASQARAPEGGTIEGLVKTRVPVKVIDVDAGRKRIVVSHRRAVSEERRAKRAELQASLQVGEVREAVVVRLTDFGAFVDLGGLDALIPMRELAFERVDKASDVVTIGERLPVEVVRIEEGGKKIAVSRKNALPDPWRDHAEVIKHGNVVHGKVVAKDTRLQVEIAPGVIGTIRESDADPGDYELGETVEVSVQFVDRRTRRIRLSTVNAPPPVQQNQPWTGSGFAPLGVELRRRN